MMMLALKERAIITLKTELRKYTREPISETVAVRKSTMLSPSNSEFACMMLNTLPQPTTSSAEPPHTIADACDVEVTRWLSFDAFEESDILREHGTKNPMELLKCFSPLDFWETRKSQFPLPYRVECRYLPSPCAESFAERMFSSGGELAGNCSTATVEQSIQMRINKRFLD
jgi:hypothetical protein